MKKYSGGQILPSGELFVTKRPKLLKKILLYGVMVSVVVGGGILLKNKLSEMNSYTPQVSLEKHVYWDGNDSCYFFETQKKSFSNEDYVDTFMRNNYLFGDSIEKDIFYTTHSFQNASDLVDAAKVKSDFITPYNAKEISCNDVTSLFTNGDVHKQTSKRIQIDLKKR